MCKFKNTNLGIKNPAALASIAAGIPAVAEHLKQGDDVATKGIIYYYSPNGRYDNINKTMYDMNDMIRTALLEQPEAYETWHQALLQAVGWSTVGY